MRYPWIIAFLVIGAVVVVGIAVWTARRRDDSTTTWVANASQLPRIPAFVQARRVTRIASVALAGGLVTALIALTLVAGAPVDRRVENPTLARRDLVLCLDASGSMLPYDGAILEQVDDMVRQFSGERMSLQVWSAQSVVKFPLTDDYELIRGVLQEAAAVINRGYLGEDGDYVMVTQELMDYLKGVDAPGDEPIASLIGDGLASCVLGFDNRDQERSRTILLATDNEVMGPQIYTLQQAVQFASDHDVKVIALYPARSGVLTGEGEELQRVVEAAGGSFYQANDPGAVDGIIADIQSQQLAETAGQSRVIETDRPRTALLWGAFASLIVLGLAGWRRL